MKPSDCREYYECSAELCPLDDAWPLKVHNGCNVCPYMLAACRKPVPRTIAAACHKMARDANLPRQIKAQIGLDWGRGTTRPAYSTRPSRKRPGHGRVSAA